MCNFWFPNNYRKICFRLGKVITKCKVSPSVSTCCTVLQSNSNFGLSYAHRIDHVGTEKMILMWAKTDVWCQATHGGGGVGHNLGPAVRESHLVSSSSVVAVTLLMGVEVTEGVVILDGVGVLVHWGLVRVGGLWGSVGGDGGRPRGGEDRGQEDGGDESLKHET